jgi:hypothetical protein
MVGGDVAVPMRWATIKAEASSLTASSSDTDDYVLYVVQLERQTGEWMLVGGYAGEIVTENRGALSFSVERGIARSFLGRASYTIDANRQLAFEGIVRQTGRGGYVRTEYSQARGQHWRMTVSGAILAGANDDFLGQYHDNSHVTLRVRYSF